MTPARQQHPDDLFLITREELDRCCSQMSAAGYKVSANYIEALVLSRPHTSAPAPDEITSCELGECDGCNSQPVFICKNAVKLRVKAEREQVLDELIDELPNVERSFGGEQIDTYIETHELKELVESLRHQQEERQEQQKEAEADKRRALKAQHPCRSHRIGGVCGKSLIRSRCTFSRTKALKPAPVGCPDAVPKKREAVHG